jgi:gamma-glutamyltranspeptidase/glutathione hydrolase
MHHLTDRRKVLKQAGRALLGGILAGTSAATRGDEPATARGVVVGQPQAAQAGLDVLAAGGNAVDAVVAAALVAGVVAVPSCGIGGYGGHAVIAPADGK